MPNVYVEPHPNGRPEGSAINDYVVEDHAGPAPERQENPRPLAHPLARLEISFLSDRS